MKTQIIIMLIAAGQVDAPVKISDFIELGVVGFCLFVVLFYVFRHLFPKILEQQTELSKTFQESLDKITLRHEASVNNVAESLKCLSNDVVSVREVVATCKFKNEEKKVS